VEKTASAGGTETSRSVDARDGGHDRSLSTVEAAIADVRAGRIIIVIDDEERENEGDMVLAAQKVTPDAINRMATYARGLICVPMTRSRLRELDLGPMVGTNTAKMQTGFTVSVDYVHGTTTGISAKDRAATVSALVGPATRPEDLARPGHVFPLMAQEGGVLRRPGHTEAAVDLARLAGLAPAGVLCEVMDASGEMARLPELTALARRLGLKIIAIRDLIAYRMRTERIVERIAETRLPTEHGEFELILYEDRISGDHHLALTVGEIDDSAPVLARVHSQCLTGEVFGSLRCDCGLQMRRALESIQREGRGVFVYMRQEGRGIGLRNKLKAYRLQDEGLDTVEANQRLGFQADARDYGIGAQILRDLGARRLRLMTNNPAKRSGLAGFGLEIVDRVSLEVPPSRSNLRYLATKRDKLGHLLHLDETHILSAEDGKKGES
jgi:3,4-dihydroxy 2-butanone 4-phosphate synthase/GTP cyclohydrolase II